MYYRAKQTNVLLKIQHFLIRKERTFEDFRAISLGIDVSSLMSIMTRVRRLLRQCPRTKTTIAIDHLFERIRLHGGRVINGAAPTRVWRTVELHNNSDDPDGHAARLAYT